MSRSPRTDFPGAVHHVMNRAGHRGRMFHNLDDRRSFLARVAQLEERFGIVVLAYALMPNHFHLVVRSERGQLSTAMSWLQSGHARRVHRRLGTRGSMFGSRFKSRLVDSDAYLMHLFAYVHLNPVRIDPAHIEDPLWTSHLPILAKEEWLHADESLERFGGPQGLADYVEGVAEGRVTQEAFDPRALWEPPIPSVFRSERRLELAREAHGLTRKAKARPRSRWLPRFSS